MVGVADAHHRRGRAGPQALLTPQVDAPVRRGLADRDAEVLLELSQQTVRAPQCTAEIGADVDLVSPSGRVVEHVVEGDEFEDLDRKDLEDLRQLASRIERDASLLGLNRVQGAEHRPPLLRELLDLRVDSSAQLVGDHHSRAPLLHS